MSVRPFSSVAEAVSAIKSGFHGPACFEDIAMVPNRSNPSIVKAADVADVLWKRGRHGNGVPIGLDARAPTLELLGKNNLGMSGEYRIEGLLGSTNGVATLDVTRASSRGAWY